MADALSPEAILKSVQQVLSTSPEIPAGHRGALVTIVNNDRMEIAVGTRLSDGWSVSLIASHDWTGPNEIGLISAFTW